MFFNYRDFIKKGFLAAVGNMADYQIMLNAAGYYDKGVLISEDLGEIQLAIESKNAKLEAEAKAAEEAARLAETEQELVDYGAL
jgi:hypothetical protein